ncbi:MAG TPA: VCBS repeat-containing protein [Pyrinomonadaceae bacterium]|nr:VCBS repeat-containing protein [Pyrinomonadaceae bacterium]
MKNFQMLWCVTALLATGTFFLAGFHDVEVSANNTPQTIPFSQDWTNAGLITVNDDWSLVPGIVGYLGDISAAAATGVDPRTLLLDYSGVSAVDVIANQTNPDTLATGGVAEFAITNPSIALNGSGTADAPHIIVYLNTTGQSNIHFACNIRDLDASADDAIQQVDIQYRVGATGDFVSVPGGYVADATQAGTATLVTARDVTLPANANNQPLVQVRVITTNAVGNDEWVGVDDIFVTGTPSTVASDAPLDFNGDGRTDWVVVRNVGGGASGQLRWFWNINNSAAPTAAVDWGLNSDRLVSGDFDGDLKDDIAVWRPDAALSAAFYILNSAGFTVRIEQFGQTGDNPTVVADYNGDGTDDVAVFRASTGTWFYRTTPNGAVTYVPWGASGDTPAPGDYNGDGTADFGVQRPNGGSGNFWIRLSNGTVLPVQGFGLTNDAVVTGDFDGDAKTDIATLRGAAGGIVEWYWRPSGGGPDQRVQFGLIGDIPAPGDYDGDGRTDVAVFRNGVFYAMSLPSGAVSYFSLGAAGDRAPASYNTH